MTLFQPETTDTGFQLFTPAMFAECPVWAKDDCEHLIPIGFSDPLPMDRGPFHVAVELVTPRGTRWPGCMCMDSHFAAVFLADQSVYTDSALPMRADGLDLLRKNAGTGDPLFPLAFDTKYRFEGRPYFAGHFTSGGES
jgi:hypothetical protein